MKKVPLKLILLFFRLKFLFQHPVRSLIHLSSRKKDYSKITISELCKYLENPKVIVEAGASDGVDTLMFLQNFSHVTVFAAEPIKNQYDFLINKFKNFSNINLSQVALSSKTESVSIFVGNNSGELGGMGSSSLLKPSLHKKYFPEITFNESQLTSAVTLKKFFLDNNIKIADLLWLDIQGMELDVMKASKDTMRENVKFLHLEISRVKFYEEMPSEKDIRSFLQSLGFKCMIDRVGAISGNALYANQNLS
jgi:FkbM family methyltransferase